MAATAKFWLALALVGAVSSQAFCQPAAVSDQRRPDAPAAEDQAAFTQGASSAAAPPATGPRVAIARRIIDAAGAFDGYMRRAGAIRADFRSGGTVARAVELGAVYEPNQLEQGAIAYAALVALQDPAFVAAVQEVGRDPMAREAFAERLVEQPSTVLGAAAARTAADRVAGVLGRMGAQLAAAGQAINQAAYDVQREDWSRGPIVAPAEHLERIKAQSAIAVSLAPEDTAQLIGGVTALRAADTVSEGQGGRASPVVTRGMALAALAILGKAGEDQAERTSVLLSDPTDAHCIKMAKLDLFQCLAVAGPHYENLFCLGRHGMAETGRCIVSAAGLSQMAMTPPADRRSVFVPVAEEAPQQLERDSVFGPGPIAAASDAGVAMPVARPPAPANYSPYAGPVEP